MMEAERIEEALERAIEAMVPDHCEELLAAPVEKMAEPDSFTRQQGRAGRLGYRMAALAAGILLFLIMGGIWHQTQESFLLVSVDVNPGLELRIDRENKVAEVRASNEEGKWLAESLELSGTDAEKAAAFLADALCEQGYLKAGQENYLLFSVEGNRKKQKEQVEKQMLASIQSQLLEQEIDCEIISQEFDKSQGAERTAETYGITRGKARLVELIYKQTQAYTEKELAEMTIQELSELLKEQGMTGKDGLVTVTGTSKAGEQKKPEDHQKPEGTENGEGTGTSGQKNDQREPGRLGESQNPQDQDSPRNPENSRVPVPAGSGEDETSGEEEDEEDAEDEPEEEEDWEEEEEQRKEEPEDEEEQRKGEPEDEPEEEEDQKEEEDSKKEEPEEGEDQEEEEDSKKEELEEGEDQEEARDSKKEGREEEEDWEEEEEPEEGEEQRKGEPEEDPEIVLGRNKGKNAGK